ncbi:MAG TPA: c-type cytochrome [Beijerinckiaceae bacterium]|jgi:cytochrome c|nr:c-type cytochrome [Beijerinckiaceae bacterium]
MLGLSLVFIVPQAQAAGDRALGEYLSTTCVSCHRPDGQSAEGIPSITGWPSDQFVAVLKAYRDKTREHQIMNSLTSGLSDADMDALAEYFGSLSRK